MTQNRSICFIWIISIALFSATAAFADVLESTVTPLGTNQWRYDYTLNNTLAGLNFNEMTVYFDPALFTQLVAPSAPGNWDALLVQPDPGLPDNGFLDVLSLSGRMTYGTSETGFSVTFNFLGTGTPGPQSFDLIDFIDANTFTVVYSGTSSLIANISTVPECSTLLMMLLGLAFGALHFFVQNKAVASSKI
jgi:hypothetical protein